MSVVIQGFPNNGAYTRSDILGYKSYVALLTQTGINAPVPIVLQDDIGGISFVRSSIGTYDIISTNTNFPYDKTFVDGYDNASTMIPIGTDSTVLGYYLIYNEPGGGSLTIDVVDSTFNYVDLETLIGANGQIKIEIRIYP